MILARANHQQRAAALVAQMSIEEQALLLSGDGWWRTHALEGTAE
jgi:beta-glucosidase